MAKKKYEGLNTMKNREAFTLAELLIVVAIIAVLVGIGIPVFVSQLERARLAVDKENIRSCYAMASYDFVSKDWDGTARNITVGNITCKATVTDTVVRVTVVGGKKSNSVSQGPVDATYFESGKFYNIVGEE